MARDWKRLDREALVWLEKVWKKEEEIRKGIKKDWPVHEIGSSSKFLEENRLGIDHKARKAPKESGRWE